MKEFKGTYLFAATLPFLIAVIYAALPTIADWRHGAESPVGATYQTEKVERGDIRKIVTGSGVIRPLISVLVGSQISGQITEINATFNSRVAAGDIIALIDDKAFKSRVAQASSELALARSSLKNQEAALQKAKTLHLHAQKSEERQRALASSNNATLVNLEASQRDLDVAKTEILTAEAAIEGAQAAVQNREALLDQAQIDLEHTRIRAPIAGVVLSRLVEVGQTVAASLQSPELFRIAQDLTHMQIEAQIGESEIGVISAGQSASFSVDAYPDERFVGRVSTVRLAPNVDQNIVSYTVLIDADNTDLRLFPGMTANVRIETGFKSNVVRVPLDALRYEPENVTIGTTSSAEDDTNKHIWVVGDAGASPEARPVKVGLTDATHAEIIFGNVDQGMRVVVRALQHNPE